MKPLYVRQILSYSPPLQKNIKTDFLIYIYIHLSFIVSWCLVWFGAPISEKTSEMLHGRTDGLQTADLERCFWVPIMKEKWKAFQDIPCQDIFGGYLCDLFKIWSVFGFFRKFPDIFWNVLECLDKPKMVEKQWKISNVFDNDSEWLWFWGNVFRYDFQGFGILACFGHGSVTSSAYE